ncbi:MAG: ankyrin repeat domain-containing protein [Gammaproteobacteria bacterium]|nr:ankyrin repeat domain-containing protein [Gammaproteobacteria bacterium]
MAKASKTLPATEARKRLIAAAKIGDLKAIRGVLSLREDAIHLRNSHHNTALRSAVGAGQLDAAQLLVEYGADVHQVNHGGSSLMEAAVYSGNPDTVHWLGRNGLVVGIVELSAIGDLKRVTSVLESDPTCMNQRDRRGLTALHHAARCGHIELIKALIVRGADIHATNRHGHVPLSIAVEERQIESTEVLLANGADPNARGGHYRGSALHRAVLHRSLPIVKALLNAGADPNYRDANGKTPLHDAIGTGNQKIVVEMLASPRIDVTLRTGKTKYSEIGETALEYAKNRGKVSIVKIVKDYLSVS